MDIQALQPCWHDHVERRGVNWGLFQIWNRILFSDSAFIVICRRVIILRTHHHYLFMTLCTDYHLAPSLASPLCQLC